MVFKAKNNLKEQYNKYFFIASTIVAMILVFCFDTAIGNFRLPINELILEIRTIDLAKTILAGWSIGLSNYCLQYVTKNKFADVGIFGTYSFLQLATMITIIFVGTNFYFIDQKAYMSLIYSVIGIVSGLIFYALTFKSNLKSKKILIYGIFLNTLIFSLISLILNYVNLEPEQVNRNYNVYLIKLLGNINGSNGYESLIFQTILMFVITIYIFLNKHKLLALSIDAQKSRTLSINYNKFKLIIILLIGLMAASTYAVVGYIAFLGIAINFIVNQIFSGIKNQLLMCIVISVLITCLCQFLAKIFLFYWPINNKSLPLSAFFGFISFPLFCFSFLKRY